MPFSLSRRDAMRFGAAAVTALNASLAAADTPALAGDRFTLGDADVIIRPINHASFVAALPGLVVYNDPVGPKSHYDGLPRPDFILITHEHADHYNADTLAGLVTDKTGLIVNPAVFAMLPNSLKQRATALANGETLKIGEFEIAAVPAYNITEGRLNYHPRGRDNGYLIALPGGRIYIAGDTEDIPEMRALTDIDIAFLPMNLPYTMDIDQAARAVAAFVPKVVYPYHYKGSNIAAFAKLVEQSGVATTPILFNWYA